MPNYKYKENEYENMQNIFNFFKDILKKVPLDVRFWKIEAIILNMAKTHKPLVKKETSDLLISGIVLNVSKTIYVFKLERKTVLL